ncbi:LAGLIDADG family homing endonuclease [Clostridium sp.]|uniref:LAGLIDADG family homing endonuclease n=1 Tax=Clostridium sp. TaxID=1506 RepID=UPI0032168182
MDNTIDNKALKWLNGNQLGYDIWNKKYRYNNETFDEWLDRVSNNNEQIRQLIIEKKFLFGGRTLTNYNTYQEGASTSNCYSSGYAPDNLEGILELNKNIGLTYKAQGGQGISLSKIRPKGSNLSGGHTTDGIVPFMEIFNTTTAGVSQGGSRKGALMLSIDAWHKEADAFITIKSEQGKIEKANLSLEIDDDFMTCVKDNLGINEEVTVHRVFKFESGEVEYDIKPVKIFKALCKTSWDWAEPAPIFTNRFRNYNLMEFVDDYNIVTGNPCVIGSTPILTDSGYKTIDSLVGQKINVWNGYEFSEVSPMITGYDQDIIHITFSNGLYLDCTPYHKFILSDNSRTEARHLNIGDKLVKCNYPVIEGKKELKSAYTQGIFSGDGFVNQDRKAKYVSFYGIKKELVRYCNIISKRESNESIDRDTYNVDVDYDKTFVPSAEYTIKSRLEWLAGIIDTDGSRNDVGGSISISSIDKKFLNNIQLMLQTLGINSTVNIMKNEGIKNLPDGNGGIKGYNCQTCYRLIISAFNTDKLNKLGLKCHRVNTQTSPNRDATRFITVTSIEYGAKEEKVYCFTEYKNHSGIFNGIITAQCGEQPLPKDGACNLGSINLSEFVVNPYTSKSYFDMESFKKAVDISIEALDEVIDYGYKHHALQSQRDMAYNYRNIGLGIMGLGSMFFKLGVAYGDNDSVKIIDEIMIEMFRSAVFASNRLAKTKEVFPKYSDKVLDSTIIANHFSADEIAELKIYGLRNCSLISVAPSGSIGTMLNITTGVEPAFRISYKRKTESLHKDKDVYYDVYIQEAEEYLKVSGEGELPPYFISSESIDYRDRIEIQAIIQNHTDTAISSTVNLNNQATVEDVQKLYLLAWEKGIKGITIYRDGCRRSGILTTGDTNKKDGQETDKKNEKDLPRSTIVNCSDDLTGKKRKLITGCGSLHLQAWADPSNGNILEIYLSKGSTGGCMAYMNALSRTTSYALRGGCPIEGAIDQLESIPACPSYTTRTAVKHDTSAGSSCPHAIAKALKVMQQELWDELNDDDIDEKSKKEPKINKVDKYNKINKVNEIKSVKCPECGEELVFEGGCNSCKNCGYSKCE